MIRGLGKITLNAGVSALALGGMAYTVPAVAQEAPAASASTQSTPASEADAADQGIIVTARRKALADAISRKRNSDTIIDSVVADDAGKLPDNSITEVLQRVSGVSIVRFAALGDPDRFSAEGSGIQVRGLSGITATLNGREVFGANGGGGLSWGEVTPELMAAVDIFKASTASQIEGGTGGTIDLRTKMPFDFKKPAIAGTFSGGYGDLAKRGTYGGSLLVTKTWDTNIGRIGVLIDAAYSKFNSASSFLRSEPYYTRIIGGQSRSVPGGFDFGQEQFSRTRKGFYEALQWQPTDNLRLFQTAFISNYQSVRSERSGFIVPNNQDSSQVALPLSGDAKFDENGALISASAIGPAATGFRDGANTIGAGWVPADQQVNCQSNYGQQAQNTNWSGQYPTCSPASFGYGSLVGSATSSTRENETRDFSQGFTWDATDRLRVSGAVQFVQSFARGKSFTANVQSDILSYSVDRSGEFPKYSVNANLPLNQRANYQWASIGFPVDDNTAHMFASNLDAAYDLGDGFFREIAVGGRYANRTERDNQLGTYWAPLGRDWNGSPQRTLTDGRASDTEFYDFDNFFGGRAIAPASFFVVSPSVTGTLDPLYIQQTYGYPNESNGAQPDPFGANNRYGLINTRVQTKSAYAQLKFANENKLSFTGNFGLRYVHTSVASTGQSTFTNGGTFYLSQADANADQAAGTESRVVQAFTERSSITDTNAYSRLLPSFNINFKPASTLAVRFALNKTMSPPGYEAIRATALSSVILATNANNVSDDPSTPNVNESVTYPGVFTGYNSDRGNTKLRPTMALNLDASLEWYPTSNLNLHVSGFHKILTDLILYGSTVRPFSRSFTRADGTTGTATGNVTANEIYNAPKKSFITGFEIGGRKFFNELPAPFNGLGVEANFTYIDSRSPSALARDINGNEMDNIPIVGLSKYNYNVQLLYERKKLSARLAWSWRSQYLQTTNGNGTTGAYLFFPNNGSANRLINYSLPVYADAYGQLDAGISYAINDHLKISLQGTNLTNATTRTLMSGYANGSTQVRSWFLTDRRIEGTVNIAF